MTETAKVQNRYDLVVIGGGAAGISATAAAAGLGAHTLLVEKAGRLGGECSWTGCVPSKALIHLAAVAQQLREYGAPNQADDLCARSLADTRELTAQIARDSDTKGFLEKMGAEVIFGTPRLTGEHAVVVDSRSIRARRVILATGSSPTVPEIPGLLDAGFLTNQTLFDLEAPPARLVIIGGGPIGIETAQAFQRLGSQVTVLTRADRILPKDDAELTQTLAKILGARGVRIELGVQVERVERVGSLRCVHFTRGGEARVTEGEQVLVATGRRANVEDLGFESVGLIADPHGLPLNAHLRADRPWIFAAGDVLGHHQFSHAAEEEARTAVRNALFPFGTRQEFQWIPWCTFTDPELAHLGATEEDLAERGARYRIYRQEFAHDDRARTDQQGKGLVKLLATPTGRLLGAHILGPRAGELMNEIVLGVRKGARVADLALAVHIYPTLGLAVQRAADHWFEDVVKAPWTRRLVHLFTRRA